VGHDKRIRLSVTDAGSGIPKGQEERVFERFFRDETNALVIEAPGTGLGLSIVKDYVQMHDGVIWLESDLGKGTTFFVRLPALSVSSEANVVAPLAEPSASD